MVWVVLLVYVICSLLRRVVYVGNGDGDFGVVW